MIISSAKFLKSADKLEHCPEQEKPEFAFIGRSNVGKSTLINLICRRKDLAKVSKKPGKTQLINYFDIISKNQESETQYERSLVDLPGYGYAKVSQSQRANRGDMICEYLLERKNLRHIFALVDSSIPPQDIDIDFVQWCQEENISFSLVFTKSDKKSQKITAHNKKNFFQAIQTNQIHHTSISMKKPHSIAKVIENIQTLLQE